MSRRRVVVTGLAGSGKSTLSRALAAKTGLPIVYLDLAFWQPGWTAPTDAGWRDIQREVLQVVTEYGREKGYSLVLERSAGVWYVSERTDMTKDIIDRYNAKAR